MFGIAPSSDRSRYADLAASAPPPVFVPRGGAALPTTDDELKAQQEAAGASGVLDAAASGIVACLPARDSLAGVRLVRVWLWCRMLEGCVWRQCFRLLAANGRG
jgi:hypothetical protein